MYSTTQNATFDSSKLYKILYNNQNFRNVQNAFFGRANKPFKFRFLEIGENHYLLVRYEDGLIVCCNDGELDMSNVFAPNCIIVRPVEVKEGAFALAVQNQGIQKYICYDGFGLHEYYIGIGKVKSIEKAAIWKIQETSAIQHPTDEYTQFKLS